MRPLAPLTLISILAADIHSAAAVDIQLGLEDSMMRHDAYVPLQQRVRQDSHQHLPTVTITAAGRERESTQVLLRSEVNTTVEVIVGRPAELPLDAFRVERLGFVWATNATSDPTQTRTFPIRCPAKELHQGGCWVSDPVLPLQNDTYVFLPAGLTVSLWLTFAAPAGVEALGRTYSASVTIADYKLALQLQVRHFALPLTPNLKNTVQLDVAHLHRCFPSQPEKETYRRYRQYALFALRELRLNPGSIYDSWQQPGQPCRFRDYQSCFNISAAELAQWVREEGLNSFTIPSSPLNHTAAFVEELRHQNISHLANFYGFDEFNGPMSNIASAFAPLKAAFPEISTLTTAYVVCCPGLVKTPVPFDAQALAALSVDAVTPQTNYLPSMSNISAVQKVGRQVWTYISVQPYKPYQDWRLDNPLVDNRALFWLVRAFGFDGLLHWGVNQWGGDSSLQPISTQTDGFIQPSDWNMATSPGSWMQGDGKLLYCGEHIPLPSVRLANVRDGMEDYDYLVLAHDVDKASTRTVLKRVSDGACASCAERNLTVIREAREALATIIEKSVAL